MDRQTQAAFTIFTGQKFHGDELVKQAQNYIEANVSEKITVEDLAAKFAVGRRHFDRRFIKATGNTPAEYLQRVKMEAAKRLAFDGKHFPKNAYSFFPAVLLWITAGIFPGQLLPVIGQKQFLKNPPQ